jgi:threonine/homoserine/homoserine lactone efflux protein
MGVSAARLSLPVLMLSAFFVSLITVALPNPITLVASRLAISRRIGHAVWFLIGVTAMDIALFAMLAGGAAPLLARIGAMPAIELIGGCGLLAAGIFSLRRLPGWRSSRQPAATARWV